jgi:hypothetical protein
MEIKIGIKIETKIESKDITTSGTLRMTSVSPALPASLPPGFPTGIPELDLDIMMNLDDESLGRSCSTSQYLSVLCEDDIFWKRRAERVMPGLLPIKERMGQDTTWRLFYYVALRSAYVLITSDSADAFTNLEDAYELYQDVVNREPGDFVPSIVFLMLEKYVPIDDPTFVINTSSLNDPAEFSKYPVTKIDHPLVFFYKSSPGPVGLVYYYALFTFNDDTMRIISQLVIESQLHRGVLFVLLDMMFLRFEYVSGDIFVSTDDYNITLMLFNGVYQVIIGDGIHHTERRGQIVSPKDIPMAVYRNVYEYR